MMPLTLKSSLAALVAVGAVGTACSSSESTGTSQQVDSDGGTQARDASSTQVSADPADASREPVWVDPIRPAWGGLTGLPPLGGCPPDASDCSCGYFPHEVGVAGTGWDVAVDGNGNVYADGDDSSPLHRFDYATRAWEELGELDLHGWVDLEADAYGRVLVSAEDGMHRFDPETSTWSLAETARLPIVAMANDGRTLSFEYKEGLTWMALLYGFATNAWTSPGDYGTLDDMRGTLADDGTAALNFGSNTLGVIRVPGEFVSQFEWPTELYEGPLGTYSQRVHPLALPGRDALFVYRKGGSDDRVLVRRPKVVPS